MCSLLCLFEPDKQICPMFLVFRSGKYVYKPTMSVTCCPMYPIRCDVANFHLSASQKKVIKRVNRYLNYDQRLAKDGDDTEHDRPAVPEAAQSVNVRSDEIGDEAVVATCHNTIDDQSVASKNSGASTKRLPKPGQSIAQLS